MALAQTSGRFLAARWQAAGSLPARSLAARSLLLARWKLAGRSAVSQSGVLAASRREAYRGRMVRKSHVIHEARAGQEEVFEHHAANEVPRCRCPARDLAAVATIS